MTAVDSSIADHLLNSVGECLSPEVAQRLVDLRADAKLQDRIDELADKSNAGALTPPEHAEYEQYVRLWQFMTLLQAKAREVLESRTGAA